MSACPNCLPWKDAWKIAEARVTELQTLGSKHVIERQEMRARNEELTQDLSRVTAFVDANARASAEAIKRADVLTVEYDAEVRLRLAAEQERDEQRVINRSLSRIMTEHRERAEVAEPTGRRNQARRCAAEIRRLHACAEAAEKPQAIGLLALENFGAEIRRLHARIEAAEKDRTAAIVEYNAAAGAIANQRELILSLRNKLRAVRESLESNGGDE